MSQTFTDLYVEYCSEQTDAPPVFHRFLSYLIVSSVVNRKIYMSFGYKKLYANLYFLIVAPSSSHRKSWSQNLACYLIKQVYPDFVLPDCSSRESFVAEISAADRIPTGSGLIKVDEFKGFMNRVKHNHHLEGFLQDLSTSYDGDSIYRRKGVSDPEIYRIDEPFLNMTAACSLDWLHDSIESGDISGGFLARFIWVVYEDKIDNPMPLPNTPSLTKFEELKAKLVRISDFIGPAYFSVDALDYYSDWYRRFYGSHQGGMWDANYQRISVIIQKISMLNAVMRMEAEDATMALEGLQIDLGDMKNAVRLIEDTVTNFTKISIGSNKLDSLTKKILAFIIKHNGASRSMIINGVRGTSAKVLDEIIKTLEQAEVVIIDKVLKKTMIKPNDNSKTYLLL